MLVHLPAMFLVLTTLLGLITNIHSFPIQLSFFRTDRSQQSIALSKSAVRIAFPNDVAGEWDLYQNVDDFDCPDMINHTTWKYKDGTPVVIVPHNTILHDGDRCDSLENQKILDLYQSDNYANLEPIKDAPPIPDDVKRYLRSSGINVDISFALNGAGENFFFGAETVLRECGGKSVFRTGTTVYIVRPFNPIRVRRIEGELEVDYRYLIIVPAFQNSVCVYRNALPNAGTNQPEPTPFDLDSDGAEGEEDVPDSEDDDESDSEEADPEPSEPPSPPQDSESPTPVAPVPGEPESEASPDAAATVGSMEPSPSPSTSASLGSSPSVSPVVSSDAIPDAPIPVGTSDDESDGDSDPGATIESSPEDDGNVCFPAEATVKLSNGKLIRMEDLQAGDKVQVGDGKWSRIFGFSHRRPSVLSTFMIITTLSGHTLRATPSHFIYVNGMVKMAREVELNDYLTLADGSHSTVIKIDRQRLAGLYNPQTEHGDIVVDGLRATTFTASVDITFAHAALAPFRALHYLLPFDALDVALNAGLRCLVEQVPKGKSVM